jgi:hypothetical protein
MIPRIQDTKQDSAHGFCQLYTAATYTLGSIVARSLKLSFILGSKAAFFSLNQALAPSIGFFAQPLVALCVYLLRACSALLFFGISPFSALVYHIPSFCAALYLSSSNKSFKVLLPLLCMVTFVMHPIGSQAWVYALYWLIPASIALIPVQSIYMQALGSTFTAHAVGSVLWLFTHNLTIDQWQALTHVVWAERLLFAGCMTAYYYLIRYAQDYVQEIRQDIMCNI